MKTMKTIGTVLLYVSLFALVVFTLGAAAAVCWNEGIVKLVQPGVLRTINPLQGILVVASLALVGGALRGRSYAASTSGDKK